MKYLSVCSGIEAASVAWHHLGWEPVGFAEIEKFPSQVLAHRFPGVPNLGDMTKFREWGIASGTIDILVGGTPCQAFSVAGLRKGLADPRGNLALTFVAMVDHYRPEWVVWENVPGVLSSNGGRDFGAFLGALGQLGYGFAYRVLDAQYFGVAQRRRRVFVVAHASGDPRRCAEVLFEPESLRGDPAPSREAGQKTTADPGASASGGGLWDTVGALCADTHPGAYSGQDAYTGRIIPSLYEFNPSDGRVTGPVEQCSTVLARWGTGGNQCPLVTDGSIGFAENFNAIELTQTAPAMTTSGYYPTQNAGGLGALQCNAEQAAKAYSIAPGRQGTPEKVDDIHVTEQNTSRKLDGTCADPERRQGGTLIVQPSFVQPGEASATHFRKSKRAQSVDDDETWVESEATNTMNVFDQGDVRATDVVVQPGEASAFSWQSGAEQLQRCQIEAVMIQPFAQNQLGEVRAGEVFNTINTNSNASGRNTPLVQTAMHVRRLTPVECERLQGFPDGWTDIRPGGKDTPDSPRYKALGNSMAVPVMRWIGERIAKASRG
jgi:DNA (cytosine-5)-methyltransferase 1